MSVYHGEPLQQLLNYIFDPNIGLCIEIVIFRAGLLLLVLPMHRLFSSSSTTDSGCGMYVHARVLYYVRISIRVDNIDIIHSYY